MKTIKCVLVLAVVITTAADCRALDKTTANEKTDKQLIVAGNNKFALELYAKLRSEEGNLFFSPYSISTALAMAHAGARGQTEAQMAGVLHFPLLQSRAQSCHRC
jgi:serpin B